MIKHMQRCYLGQIAGLFLSDEMILLESHEVEVTREVENFPMQALSL